jgi:hypothetical protein
MVHYHLYWIKAFMHLLAAACILLLGIAPAIGQSGTLVGTDSKGPSKPTPRTADGHPDLNGFWRGTRDTKPVGNIAKDLPGLKLPFTPAGEAAWKHNVTATIDPESL